MTIINDGSFFRVEELLGFLTDSFSLDEEYGDYSDIFSYIENHEGGWTFGFKSIPPSKLMIALIALFETRMAIDGIFKVIFHYDTPQAIEIDDVAGCYKQNPEAMITVLRHCHQQDLANQQALQQAYRNR